MSATALALIPARASAQDGVVVDGQQSQAGLESSPDMKSARLAITGAWTGTLEDNLAGGGALHVNFAEASNGKLNSEWSFAFSGGTDFGTMNGKVTAKKVALRFIFAPKSPYTHCEFSVTDLHASETEITGRYHFIACGPGTHDEYGTLDISPD
ncbi:MAG: hypothetical protein ACYDC3_07135 [Candidatus Binataceae bacterium]